jgi:hypothetical protein
VGRSTPALAAGQTGVRAESVVWHLPVPVHANGSANGTLSAEEGTELLNRGIHEVDASVVETFASLLPRGNYLPLLLEVRP